MIAHLWGIKTANRRLSCREPAFMPRPLVMSRSSLALDNLRAVVILVVLGFHSVLAYVQWIPVRAGAFDAPPYGWRSFPIVDGHRWLGFDLFCAWQDVYLMSLMFLLSGLFVWPSLVRKKSLGFARDRVRRLGIPYLFGVAVLIPIAIYPAYRATAADPSVSAYVRQYLALPFWPNGQLWFLWQLLALNFIAAALYAVAPRAFAALGPWSTKAGQRPAFYFTVLVGLSAAACVPLALAFTPWAWSDSGWFAVQWCRPLLYGVYFFAGVGIGAGGIDCGLTAADGALRQRWKLWLAVAIVSLSVWMGLTSQTMNGDASVALEIAADLSFVAACAGGCFFVVAAALHFGGKRSRVLDSLSTNAYSLYLVHYDFVVWLQYALLGSTLFAVVKGAVVFAATVALSWITILAVVRVPFGAWLIGAARPAAAAVPRGRRRAEHDPEEWMPVFGKDHAPPVN
jgi:surface polysaccharide O-acyltransferase-like enzyme